MKMPSKYLTRRRNIYRLALKVKKSHKFITTVKHLVKKNIFIISIYIISFYFYYFYDILSKKFIEDSAPKTTPETLKKGKNTCWEYSWNVFTARGLSILTTAAPSHSNISRSGLSFCEGDTFSKHYNISDFAPVRMSP